MRRVGFTGDIWPDDIQQLLLRAALFTDERGSLAWSEVRPRIDVDQLPGELHRLMPLLSKVLTAAGTDDPELARLKGVYQFSWYRNAMLFKDAGELLGELADAAIPTMLLRGAAIATGHRDDAGTRPMNDVDVLVPEADLDRARKVANVAGWPPADQDQPLERRLAAAPVRSSSGRVIRLHWRPTPNVAFPDASWEAIWERAAPVRFGNVDTLVPSRADHLVHACVDGARANSGAFLRWITDAMALLRSRAGDLRWEVVASEARRLRVTLLIFEALRYLNETLDAEVPGTILETLAQSSTTARDRVAHRLSLTTTPRVASAAELLGRFLRSTADKPIVSAGAAAPEFLATILEVDRRRDLPLVALKRVGHSAISPAPPLASLSQAGAPQDEVGSDSSARRGSNGSRLSAS